MKKILIDPYVDVHTLLANDILNRMDYRVQLLVPDRNFEKTHYILVCMYKGVYIYTNIPIDLDHMLIDENFRRIKFIMYTDDQLKMYDDFMSYLKYMGLIAMSMDIEIKKPVPINIGGTENDRKQ